MIAPDNNRIFSYEISVPIEAADENGHVNNVSYVQWMQDAAVRHFDFLGGLQLMELAGATWVVRSHWIEYLSPAFPGELIEVQTWVANIKRVHSLRKYQFIRKSNGDLLVKGETDWVFVNGRSGRPLTIPKNIINLLPLLPEG